MNGFTQELRYTLRGLTKNPGFALAAILMLALAIVANTAVFSVIDKVLVRPLPVVDADRIVVIWPRERATPTTIGEISHWTFRSWQKVARSFDTLAAIGSVNWSMVLREYGDPTTVPIAAVSASFFPLVGLFGVQPADPITLIGMAIFFMFVAILAMILPARRALRVDPLVSLRYE